MQAYLEYLAEKKGHTLEITDSGFFVWSQVNDVAVFIHELYVAKDKRGTGRINAWTADLVARLPPKVEWIFGEVDTKDRNPEMSLAALLKFGSKIHEIKDNRYIVCYYKLDRGDS
jgi:hypothetical protein